MAKKSDKPDPGERADLFIAEWQEKYSIALSQARAAAETTATAAWRENYIRVMRDHRKIETARCMSILDAANYVHEHGSNEETEKAIKDLVKELADEREQHAAWRVKAVAPYQIAAVNCGELLAAVIRAANDTESAYPLPNAGLADEVKARVALWPAVKWDDASGVVNVDESPDAGQATATA